MAIERYKRQDGTDQVLITNDDTKKRNTAADNVVSGMIEDLNKKTNKAYRQRARQIKEQTKEKQTDKW